jgi:SAM-dependent methyltransferase
MDYIEKNIELYEEKNKTYGRGILQSLAWSRIETQTRRFKKFIELFDFKGKSVLDVGCGYGDFYSFLLSNEMKPKAYIGCELMSEHCAVVREKLPGDCLIIEGDFLKNSFPKVDISVLSGTLNVEFDNWLEISRNITDKMWEFSSEGIAFNMQSSHGLRGEYKEKVLSARNIDPGYWCAYAHSKACKYGLYHDYMHYDYTIGMWKAELGWQEEHMGER